MTVNRIDVLPSANGASKPGKARKRPSRRKVKPAVPVSALRRWTTIGAGCGIPALSLGLSSVGGSLCEAGMPMLGAATLTLCCGVLAVSLSHLAKAFRDITHSRPWQSWAMAVVVDCSLIVCELARVNGYASWTATGIMAGVTLFSMWLNCWAFLSDAE